MPTSSLVAASPESQSASISSISNLTIEAGLGEVRRILDFAETRGLDGLDELVQSPAISDNTRGKLPHLTLRLNNGVALNGFSNGEVARETISQEADLVKTKSSTTNGDDDKSDISKRGEPAKSCNLWKTLQRNRLLEATFVLSVITYKLHREFGLDTVLYSFLKSMFSKVGIVSGPSPS